MPELPEVQTVVSQLEGKVIGKRITELVVVCQDNVSCSRGVDLRSLGVVSEIERKGKFIIIHTDGGSKAVIHLRMTGKLVWEACDGKVPQKGLRAVFNFSDGSRLLFYSVRGFAKLDVYREDEQVAGLQKLGLEPFDKRLDKNLLSNMLAGRKVAIKAFLMDQRYVVGIGNIYASEILYRVGLHPMTRAGSLSEQKVEELLRIARSVLSQAIDCCGTTVSDYRNIDDKSGQFQNFLQVYQKDYCPMGHKLEKITICGRGTYFCPVCQKKMKVRNAEQTCFLTKVD